MKLLSAIFASLCLMSLMACKVPFEALPSLELYEVADPYDLPDPLVHDNGRSVGDGVPEHNAILWWWIRRNEILRQFKTQVYGKTPTDPIAIAFNPVESSETALGGMATRKQVRVDFGDGEVGMDLLIYLPSGATGPVPVLLIANFRGNHSIHADPDIILPSSWVPNSGQCAVTENIATEGGRGCRSYRYPVESILARGYGIATIYYGDLDPDYDDGFQNGIHPLFYKDGQTVPAADEWGAVGAWAWGLSRAMDYLETDADIDPERVAVLGHSRTAKAALWAGAQDYRFSAVISNSSGAVGAALSRRAVGETVNAINILFPHWFADNFVQYSGNESLLPVDQHQLIALMAPRPVYIASSEDDAWADPQGEFEGGLYASDVYRFLGREGLGVLEMPPVDTPVMSIIGYHIRTGGHDLTNYDWEQFMNFTDIHML